MDDRTGTDVSLIAYSRPRPGFPAVPEKSAEHCIDR
jgi:hypothetical protein